MKSAFQITQSYSSEHIQEQQDMHLACMEKFEQLYTQKDNTNAALILTLNYFVGQWDGKSINLF